MGSTPMRADYNTTSVLTTLLYGQKLRGSSKSVELLEMCELATLWEFDSILEAMSTRLVASATVPEPEERIYGRNLWELAVEHFGAGHKECV
jgi:hypothetical protein